MASHRPTQSISSNNLLPPTTPTSKQQRRMTSPNLGQGSGRPPSPLRNGFVPSSSTGIDPYAVDDDEDDDDDDEDDDDEGRGRNIQRSSSPASSVSQMTTSFAQRMNNLVGGMAPRSPSLLPSDAELEAESERERDRTRREAERILSREAEERKQLEERVLAMMENTGGLPPPPSRSQTMPNPPSPSSSQKDGTSWWTAAKNKLTPTKELTPAQQVIQDAKTREKEVKKQSKGKDKEKDLTLNTQPMYPDPALLNLNTPQQPRRPAPGSPASPTPSRSNMAPNLSPSPMRPGEAGSSPSREAPPLYAQFNAQGTLDVHVTLLTIAKRFEKLEKWTVGHVRALEERMSDVERWLVDKEKEKDTTTSSQAAAQPISSNSEAVSEEMRELREEIVELQGRIGEIGREMARMAIAPGNLSSSRSRQSAEVIISPSASTSIQHERITSSTADIVDPDPDTTFSATPHARTRVPSISARHSTSPPMTSSKTSIGTRLPYPTGDYAPDPSISGFFSPTNSPPSSVSKTPRPISMNITGLPAAASSTTAQQPPLSSAASSYSLGSYSSASSISPIPGPNNTNGLTSPSTSPAPGKTSRGLPVPPHKSSSSSLRQSSTSPTPRKRYTVALGGPIVPPDDYEEQQSLQRNRPTTPHSSRGRFTSSPVPDSDGEGLGKNTVDEEDEREFEDETIGKSKAAKVSSGLRSNGQTAAESTTKSLPSSPSNHRMRAQSAYGLSSIQAQSPNTMAALGGDLPSVAPLRPKLRSKSTERLERGSRNGFVDPLVLRKQEAAGKLAMPKPVGKVPVGQLVAFFDGDRK